MDLLVSYKKIHSELMCCKFEDETWSLFTYYIEAKSLFFYNYNVLELYSAAYLQFFIQTALASSLRLQSQTA